MDKATEMVGTREMFKIGARVVSTTGLNRKGTVVERGVSPIECKAWYGVVLDGNEDTGYRHNYWENEIKAL